jgi:hypothetical protein
MGTKMPINKCTWQSSVHAEYSSARNYWQNYKSKDLPPAITTEILMAFRDNIV